MIRVKNPCHFFLYTRHWVKNLFVIELILLVQSRDRTLFCFILDTLSYCLLKVMGLLTYSIKMMLCL